MGVDVVGEGFLGRGGASGRSSEGLNGLRVTELWPYTSLGVEDFVCDSGK